MNKPARYVVYTEKRPNGYTFKSLWKQSENIIKRVEKRNDKVTRIIIYSTSTGKFISEKYY